MMPEVIHQSGKGPRDPCALANRWLIEDRLADALLTLADRLEFSIMIISGFRTQREQDALRRRKRGQNVADNDRSTHLSCPATGVDIWTGVAPVNAVKARLGAEATIVGLRWGGGSAVAPTGIPSDWNHFDLGPRIPV